MDDVARVIEAVGAGILVLGGITVLARYTLRIATRARDAYGELRRNLGRVILLGLEVLIIGDIIRTIAVEPTIENVAVLGLIVVIRILLSFSLEVEIEGTWPWSRWRLGPPAPSSDPEG